MNSIMAEKNSTGGWAVDSPAGIPTIAIGNQKGGTGKTTVAVHLAVAAHRAGLRATLLDADPQGSALDWHRRTPDEYDGPEVERVGRNRTLAGAIGKTESDVVVIDSPRTIRRLLMRPNEYTAAEAFVDRHLDIEGDLIPGLKTKNALAERAASLRPGEKLKLLIHLFLIR